jgi:flagella basal body P-ring formation protein FlgA
MLAFQRGPETMMQLPVTLDLSLSEEAGRPDVARGNAVTIVIQHGLVEVSASAVAGADGDVGATIPLTIRTSGKVVRGRLLDKDHAVIVEGL